MSNVTCEDKEEVVHPGKQGGDPQHHHAHGLPPPELSHVNQQVLVARHCGGFCYQLLRIVEMSLSSFICEGLRELYYLFCQLDIK